MFFFQLSEVWCFLYHHYDYFHSLSNFVLIKCRFCSIILIPWPIFLGTTDYIFCAEILGL